MVGSLGAAVACFIAVRNEKAGCGAVFLSATGISGTPKAFLTPGTLRTENYQTCHFQTCQRRRWTGNFWNALCLSNYCDQNHILENEDKETAHGCFKR